MVSLPIIKWKVGSKFLRKKEVKEEIWHAFLLLFLFRPNELLNQA
jgi:hypothetical protein